MPRERAQSDPMDPARQRRQEDPTPSTLTAESLARLSLVSRPSRWQHSNPSPVPPPAWLETSVTPSVTSISDEDEGAEDKIDVSMNADMVKAWIRKGKFRATDGAVSSDRAKKCDAGSLPPEILLQVFRCLSSPTDINNALLVSRMWSLCAYPVLWQHPNIHSVRQLSSLTRILISPTNTFTYARSIRRLNLSALGSTVSDDLIDGLESCIRVERLTISNTDNVTSSGFRRLIKGMSELHALDLSGCSGVGHKVLSRIAEACPQLQGLNLGKCEHVDDEGIEAIARKRLPLRRLKVPSCRLISDSSMVKLIVACPLLMEMDLASLPRVHNATLYAAFLHSTYIREMKMSAHSSNLSTSLTDAAFPDLLHLMSREGRLEEDDFLPDYIQAGGLVKPPSCLSLEYLRVVDLTGNKLLTDAAIDQLVINAPKLRHLALTKCEELTDQAMVSVAKLGKHLHHIHLGHVAQLTDEGIRTLVTSCIRIRYLDIACCPLITDQSIHDLSQNLPKLRRIGLVKVVKLTDEGVYSLTSRHASLERIHLSYCENVSVKAIACLLNRLHLLNHLSLTGVGAFCNPELQQYCRQTPPGLNEHQTSSFCVFSSHGIAALRTHLNSRLAADALHSDISERGGSVSSSSSITVPAETPSPPVTSRQSTPNIFNARQATFLDRRNSRQPWRDTTGIPHSAFASSATFLIPETVRRPASDSPSSQRTHRFSTARAYREEHRQASQPNSTLPSTRSDIRSAQDEPLVMRGLLEESARLPHVGGRGPLRGLISTPDESPTDTPSRERVIRRSRARDSLIAAVSSSPQRPTELESTPRPVHAGQITASSPFRWMVDSYKRWGGSEGGGNGDGSGSGTARDESGEEERVDRE